jgi:hypothetical protein
MNGRPGGSDGGRPQVLGADGAPHSPGKLARDDVVAGQLAAGTRAFSGGRALGYEVTGGPARKTFVPSPIWGWLGCERDG